MYDQLQLLINDAVPRIAFQAIMLAQVHKLSIWYRPEPRESAVPRRANSDEIFLASVLIRYLRYLSNRSPTPVCLSVLQHATVPHARYDMGVRSSQQTTLELRIHAPQFYRHMITYDTLVNYLRYTLLDPHEENHTAWSNDAERLIDFLQISEQTEDNEQPVGLLRKLPWAVYTRFRTSKRLTGAYPDPGLPRARAGRAASPDCTEMTGSCLDNFVFKHCDSWLQIQYVWATLSLQWRAKIMGAIGGE
jgi:hypothetical protein